MRFRSINSLLVCFSLICFFIGLASISYAAPDSDKEAEINVITASDAGGGDLKANEIVLIVIATIAIVILAMWFIFAVLMGLH